MTQFDGIAIRFDPLEVAPEELKGTRPVVVVTEQGNVGANLEGSLPGSFRADARVGAEPDDDQLAGISNQDHRAGPILPYQIDQLFVVLDTSGSMGGPARRLVPGTKLAHVQSLLHDLNIESIGPEQKVTLLRFSDVLQPDKQLTVEELPTEISTSSPDGGTDFSRALTRVEEILQSAPNQKSSQRSVLLFITDGVEGFNSREDSIRIAARLQQLNVGAYLIGVGDSYDLRHIYDLSGKFGFAGWAHTPEAESTQIVKEIVPEFIKEIKANEYYLDLHGAGSLKGFYNVTPTVRAVQGDTAHVGYRREGIGVCFEERDDLKLELRAKEYAADRDHITKEIPIVDLKDATAHFEQIERAKAAIDSVVLLLAQMGGGRSLLEAIAKERPDLRDQLTGYLEAVTKFGPNSSESRSSISEIGNSVTFWQLGHTDRDQRKDEKSFRPGDETRQEGGFGDQTMQANGPHPLDPVAENPSDQLPAPSLEPAPEDPLTLHSGYLGKLSDPPIQNLPPVDLPNASAYDHEIPLGHAFLTILGNGPSRGQIFDLSDLIEEEGTLLCGRKVTEGIMLHSSAASREHALIRRDSEGFHLTDLNSTNGTWVNGLRITENTLLKPGDKIRMAGIKFLFSVKG